MTLNRGTFIRVAGQRRHWFDHSFQRQRASKVVLHGGGLAYGRLVVPFYTRLCSLFDGGRPFHRTETNQPPSVHRSIGLTADAMVVSSVNNPN